MFGLLFVAVSLSIYYFYNKYKDLYAAASKFPGPTAYPILGNSLEFASNSNGIFKKLVDLSKRYERFYRIWNQGNFFLFCYDYKDVEILLGGNKELKKTDVYKFLKPWIGEGLVSNSDIPKWRNHRKIITPTFHFKILYDFLDVFNKNVGIMCEQLKSEVKNGVFDVNRYIRLMALDNICETAMGVDINAQLNADSKYAKAIETISNIVSLRFYQVWLMPDILFNLSKYSKLQKDSLEIIHGETEHLIRERREKLKKLKENGNENLKENIDEKQRLAFLDLLLQSEEGSKLTDVELRDEVNTFMFAGQDTVSFATTATFYCLAHHRDIQEIAYNEQLEILGDSNRPPTHAEIQEMKYLDRVLKEVLRLYPSAPLIGRELTEDFELSDGSLVPKGGQIIVHIFAMHRDPKVWQNPDEFNPDNFLPEAVQSRNCYSYIPFSAGPRNCLGQKYAMLALKATFSTVLRKFIIHPSPDPDHELKLAAEVTMASTNGCHIRLELRK